MDELWDYYRGRLNERVDELRALQPIETHDDAIRRVAHQLRGTGASYGFHAVSEAAGAVEDAAPEALAEALETLIGVLRREAATEGRPG